MKKFLSLTFLFLITGYLYSEKVLVDKILSRVNGDNILHSDTKKPRIGNGGQPYDLEQAKKEIILIQQAAKTKMLPTELDVEKQIVSMKMQNDLSNMSDKQFEEELKKEGFTLDEYKKQLATLLAVQKLKGAELSERVVVTNQEVEDYYSKHPVTVDTKYLIQIADLTDKDIDPQTKKVKKENIKWESLDWVEQKDLSDNLKFVTQMDKNQISKPVKTQNGYRLVKLIDKKDGYTKTLKDCYIEVERTIQEEKREKFEHEFEEELLSKAVIVDLN